jgi:hypothetical protein
MLVVAIFLDSESSEREAECGVPSCETGQRGPRILLRAKILSHTKKLRLEGSLGGPIRFKKEL